MADNRIYFMAAEYFLLKDEGVKYHLNYWRNGHIYELYNGAAHIRIRGPGSRSLAATVEMIHIHICCHSVAIWKVFGCDVEIS